MTHLATPPFMRDNPDSLAARMWRETVEMREEAYEKVHQSAPRNNPGEYITLEEIAQRIGYRFNSMQVNSRRTSWFPFTPVVKARGNGEMITYYYSRAPVELWIGKYLDKKRARERYAARPRG